MAHLCRKNLTPRNSLMFLSGQVASVSSAWRGQRQETWHRQKTMGKPWENGETHGTSTKDGRANHGKIHQICQIWDENEMNMAWNPPNYGKHRGPTDVFPCWQPFFAPCRRCQRPLRGSLTDRTWLSRLSCWTNFQHISSGKGDITMGKTNI